MAASGSAALEWHRTVWRCLRPVPLSRLTAAVGPTSAPTAAPMSALQRRWWFDPDATRKAYDKPAVTGARYSWIKGSVPVVMLEQVRGLGKKGQIVSVKRGYARHHLVPKGLAVFGTWENIDAYADPALMEDPALKARVASERGLLPFDWVDDIQLRFVRWTREDEPSLLMEALNIWDLLEALSASHELDLLPGNVTLPDGGLVGVGVHEVPVRIAFRSPDMAAGRYTIRVDAVSQQSLQDELRREEMAKAVAESIRFQLPQRGGAVELSDDEESDGEAFDE
mmetsp:Transcript_139226/g.445004  ORF Transcript_139226/g.445004 Transcript_139226/m.445004 type:complete len:282 (-) Transcript_139226:49-894(-)